VKKGWFRRGANWKRCRFGRSF